MKMLRICDYSILHRTYVEMCSFPKLKLIPCIHTWLPHNAFIYCHSTNHCYLSKYFRWNFFFWVRRNRIVAITFAKLDCLCIVAFVECYQNVLMKILVEYADNYLHYISFSLTEFSDSQFAFNLEIV